MSLAQSEVEAPATEKASKLVEPPSEHEGRVVGPAAAAMAAQPSEASSKESATARAEPSVAPSERPSNAHDR